MAQPVRVGKRPAVTEIQPPIAAAERLRRLPRYPDLSECVDDERPGAPCQHTECRYHLANRGYWEHRLSPTRDCAIDFANEGPHTLDEVAAALGTSGERVRQIEEQALEVLRHSEALKGWHHEQ